MADDYILTMPKDQQNDRRKITTFTRRYVNPLEMEASDISIIDIAHHLSIINRYTGASPEPFSVAQHSVMGTEYFGTPDMKLAFLLHDAAEAYFNDIASPVKHDPRMKWYRDLEHETCKLIFRTFGLDPELLTATKFIDDVMFGREVESWWGSPVPGSRILCWTAARAELEFLELFSFLRKEMRNHK